MAWSRVSFPQLVTSWWQVKRLPPVQLGERASRAADGEDEGVAGDAAQGNWSGAAGLLGSGCSGPHQQQTGSAWATPESETTGPATHRFRTSLEQGSPESIFQRPAKHWGGSLLTGWCYLEIETHYKYIGTYPGTQHRVRNLHPGGCGAVEETAGMRIGGMEIEVRQVSPFFSGFVGRYLWLAAAGSRPQTGRATAQNPRDAHALHRAACVCAQLEGNERKRQRS
jgi:hypothetical protein